MKKLVAWLLMFLIIGFSTGLDTAEYKLESGKVTRSIKVAVISDLHSNLYGEGQEKLIGEIRAADPDAILFTGDIFDEYMPDENTEVLFAGVSGDYPCYYVTGNHEYKSDKSVRKKRKQMLKDYNITWLDNASVTISIKGVPINICGISDIQSFGKGKLKKFEKKLKELSKVSKNGAYTILLSHRPEYYDLYCKYDFDLVVSGHAHGGQVRIPGILNGLYTESQGLFPKYAGGEYLYGETDMIVSRGLANEVSGVPRFYNKPELVIIEIGPAA